MGGQLFSSAGHNVSLFVSRGPHLGQKGYFNAAKIGPRGPDVAPYRRKATNNDFHYQMKH
jgi:hypothetical protein